MDSSGSIVVFWLVCGAITYYLYINKGRSGFRGFATGFLFGPFGILFSLFLSSNQAGLDQQKVKSGEFVECPHCAELIKTQAKRCKHCQTDIFPAVPSHT